MGCWRILAAMGARSCWTTGFGDAAFLFGEEQFLPVKAVETA